METGSMIITEYAWQHKISPLMKNILKQAGLTKLSVMGKRVRQVAYDLEGNHEHFGAINLFCEMRGE
jgi:hypothetical protein